MLRETYRAAGLAMSYQQFEGEIYVKPIGHSLAVFNIQKGTLKQIFRHGLNPDELLTYHTEQLVFPDGEPDVLRVIHAIRDFENWHCKYALAVECNTPYKPFVNWSEIGNYDL